MGNKDAELESVRKELEEAFKPKPEPAEQMMEIIKVGQIFVLTSGEYSAYSLSGVFRALKDIDPNDTDKWPSKFGEFSLDRAAKLTQEGFAEELPYTEWRGPGPW